MKICDTCGNEISDAAYICPHCESPSVAGSTARTRRPFMKAVNIKEDLPVVDEARRRMEQLLHAAKSERVKVLKVIHGYGSSGRGGAIREDVRGFLCSRQRSGEVRAVIPGESFSPFDEQTEKCTRQYPELKKDNDYRRGNEGITIVVL